jgi:hypothetical protein
VERTHHSAADHAHPDVERSGKGEGRVEPREFAGRRRLIDRRRPTAVHQRGNVEQREKSAGEEEAELHRVRPNDRLHATDVGIDQRQPDENENGAKDRIDQPAEAADAFAQQQSDRNAGHEHAHARCHGLEKQKEASRQPPRSTAEMLLQQLVGRVDLSLR